MVEIDSGDVLAMRDEAFSDLLSEINSVGNKASMAIVLGVGTGVLGLLLGLTIGETGFLAMLAAIPAWLFGRWLDSYRRAIVLFYEFEPSVSESYRLVTEQFDEMRGCAGKWHVSAGGAIQDLTTWKRNAGASHLVKKKATTLSYFLPSIIKSNITPPAIDVGRQRIYFLPDVALVEDRGKFGAVSYDDLRLSCQATNFIEDGAVPKDAIVIGHTWKHPNKSGGPDRRFRNNYQIPVCRYEAMYLSSASGLNELIEFSRTGVAQPFANALQRLPKQSLFARPKAIGRH